MSPNKNNFPCNRAEEVVSFLYGEISETEKADFESHLQNCYACAAELTDFSSVRSTIQDWRALDFDSLATPEFTIPFPKSDAFEKVSFIENIRRFFAFNPIIISSAAAALILLCAGFFWFISTRPSNTELAGNNLQEVGSSNAPAVEVPAGSERSIDVTSDLTGEIPTVRERDKQNTSVATAKNSADNKARKQSVSLKTSSYRKGDDQFQAQPAKNSETEAKLVKQERKSVSKSLNTGKLPTLAADVYEDKSLRLSDILDEESLR